VVNLPAVTSAPANLLSRPRPVEADASISEPKPTELKAADIRAADPKTSEPKTSDPMGNLVKATSTAPITNSIPRPPASIPGEAISGSGLRRVAAVQRALTEYGYGQLKPTGTVGSDTQAAIQKFERARKIPVTGQMSDRLVRELTAVIGHPID
jgi:hypothetical protein